MPVSKIVKKCAVISREHLHAFFLKKKTYLTVHFKTNFKTKIFNWANPGD